MDPRYIRIFSDIHLDFDIPNKLKNFNPNEIWTPIHLDQDKETILILAGDIWHSEKPFKFSNFSWMKKISHQFHSVLVLLGNHDFWGGNLQTEYLKYQKYILEQKLNNVHLIQNNHIEFNGIKFLGGTLWTDFNGKDPETLEQAPLTMNDYKYIKNGLAFSRLKPNHILAEFNKTKSFIEKNLQQSQENQKIWVLTHHAPSFQSINPQYNDDSFYLMNGLYASDLEDFIKSNHIDFWVHGHSHQYYDYKIGETRILSNPRGYTFEDTGYSETLLFDFSGNIVSI